MWVAITLLLRAVEGYGVDVDFHCKPFQGDWNGSGMHCNFSTKKLREEGGKEYFESLMAAFEKTVRPISLHTGLQSSQTYRPS